MAQTYQPGTPAPNSVPQSVIIRDNFESLMTQHAGVLVPAYAAEGMVWYDSTNKRLKKIVALGSKARGVWAMGPQINLAVSLVGNGQDGSTITADVRLQDNTLLPSADHDWSYNAGTQNLFFRNDTTPAYFVSQVWNDADVDEPVLWTSDFILTGKTWETIPNPNHENNYGSGPLSNVSPFVVGSLRAIGIEYADQVEKLTFSTTVGMDHAVLPLSLEWHEFQTGFEVEFYEDGTKRHPDTFKAQVFFDGSLINLAVYNIEPIGQVLQAFDANSYKEIIFRKNT